MSTGKSSAPVTPEVATDADVKAVAARRDGRRASYRVVGVMGLSLEVRPGGAMSWVLRYRTRAGRVVAYTVGRYDGPDGTVRMPLATARKAARQARARVDLGGDPQADRVAERRAAAAEFTTIEALGRRCLAGLQLRPRTRKEWGRLLEVEVLPTFGLRDAATVSRAEVREWAQAIVDRGAGTTANRAFEVLRRVFSWAIERDLVTTTPFLRLPLPAPRRESERVLSSDELAVLWRCLARMRGPYPEATRLLLLTGVRREAVLGARRSEVEGLDGSGPRWVVPAARSKRRAGVERPHVVPLSTLAAGVILRRLKVTDGDLLFPAHRGAKGAMTWTSRWTLRLRARMERCRRACARRAGRPKPEPMPRWRVHELRHTIATHMREDLGVSASVVALILGHTAPGARVTRIYDRSELLAERRDALERWAAWLGRSDRYALSQRNM